MKILNLQSEKQKFFFDSKYNPQFIYEETPSESYLQRHKLTAREDYLGHAKEIIAKVMKQFGTEAAFLESEGPVLSSHKTEEKIQEYLRSEGLEDTVHTVYSNNFIARTTITPVDASSFEMHIRLPIEYREQGLEGMLAHEVGTHVFRWLNEFKRPWYRKHNEFNMRGYLPTEEGLAVLHALLYFSSPYLWLSALKYFATYHAQTKSFAEIYTLLKPYVPDPERRWQVCIRVKRGLEDTSEPGGYAKDLVYLHGAIEMAEWLRKHEFQVSQLYLGKVHHLDIPHLHKIGSAQDILLPSFVTAPNYAKKMEKVLKTNGL